MYRIHFVVIQEFINRKDIVLRVIAAGLNPENCTVVRVMTPNPDTASPETTVVDALKLMNGIVEGKYSFKMTSNFA